MKKKKNCVHCGYPVGNGGDRHAKNACPPSPKPRKKARKKRTPSSVVPPRGAPVAGIRKVKHKGTGGGAG
ncbi:MAG: hypothetical protein HYS73_01050 [Parcubacteria group bacterium]|nr:hypothetical protein [Parcubacteria group bacterium]